MNQTYRIIPIYTGDVSGVCSALYELGGMVVIHDPSGCNSTYNTHDETRWYDNDSLIYISGLCERDAILGNDDKFLRDVIAAAEELHPSFIALTNSPIPFMNGTDFSALARIIEKQTRIPTFYVRANGMHDYTVGAGNAFAKLADYMEQEPEKQEPEKRKNVDAHSGSGDETCKGNVRVNILGLTPLDFDAKDSSEIIAELLMSHGFSVNVSLGMGESHSDWKRAPQADVNLVVSSTGIALAKKMEQLYRIPYVVGTPTGAFAKVLFGQLAASAADQKSVVAYHMEAPQERKAEVKSPKLVLIGEAVTMNSLAAALFLQCGVQAQVICPLETREGLLRDCDSHTEGEEDLELLLQEKSYAAGEHLVIAADPLYRPILPEHVRFVPLSHEAFSGRCFKRDRKCLVGEHAGALAAVAEVFAGTQSKTNEQSAGTQNIDNTIEETEEETNHVTQ
jgi:nitrogenase molybdenum-iron protein alpha/beta subunit